MPRVLCLLLPLLFLLGVDAYPQHRQLEIAGLRVHTDTELYDRLSLWRFSSGEITPAKVIQDIENLYKSEGYPLIKTYVVENNKRLLKLFIDEGRIGKILFLKTDTISLLWLRYKFKLKGRVFHLPSMENNMKYLRDVRGYRHASYRLKDAKNYDESLFQLDQLLHVPVIGEIFVPFFDHFGPRYDLEIDLSKRVMPKAGSDDTEPIDRPPEAATPQPDTVRTYWIDFSLNLHYTLGFIPRLRYTKLGILSDRDGYTASYSMGIMYGIDRRFSTPPRITFMKLEQYYVFTPAFGNYFTPYIRSYVYKSSAARIDLGLYRYNYLMINTMFAPGITLLSRLRMYTGLGIEIIRFDNSKNDYSHIPYYIIEKKIDIYNYIELGIVLDLVPIRIGDPLKNSILLAYDYYVMVNTFHEFRAAANFSFELKGRSIYTVLLQYNNQWGDVPFNHETSVSSSAFKGFMGNSYFSRGILAISNEYLLSVYRDYIYAGIYFDATVFQASGRDLRGIQYGIVGGPTVRVLLLDQMEFYLYVGWDWLIRSGASQRNITFNLYKKW
ncbi:MAG: hypothetical protein JXA20_08530 [Spirochaetes bacterium]|nr:hypothetical protein [Spirochaetota bacterium]